ncbi:MAG: paraquat-inducible protein A [Phycisphaerae bacterium]|nr:paraquat-inducible protein A [Phycisphaerae bacterium]
MGRFVACKTCGLIHVRRELQPGTVARCARCESVLQRHPSNSLQRTAAFALAAIILYVPANLYPILRLETHGRSSDNTIWEGVKRLWDDGDFSIAVIVFLASILIPLLKLIGIFLLVVTARLRVKKLRRMRTRLLQFIDVIGRWAMLDVFVLAILVSLVKLQGWARILPGPGLFAFGFVVVCTILSTASFDSHLIWNAQEDRSR